MMMMIVPVAASKRQIPIRCNGQIMDDDNIMAIFWEKLGLFCMLNPLGFLSCFRSKPLQKRGHNFTG